MAAGYLTVPGFDRATFNGEPVAGATLTVFQNRTTTLVPIYQDVGLLTTLTNPVTSNAQGEWPMIWASPSTLYTAVIQYPASAGGGQYTRNDLAVTIADTSDFVTEDARGVTAVSSMMGALVSDRVGGALILKKTRTTGATFEHTVEAQCGQASTDWARWMFSNHTNATSGAGQLRNIYTTFATTQAESSTAVTALNIYTSPLSPSTQDVAAGAVIRVRADGTNTGTFINQTDYGMETVRTATAGDYVEHTITGVETVLVRGMGFTNSGKIAVTATVGGSPVAAGLWIVPLTGSDRVIDFKVALDRIHQIPILKGLNPSLTYTIRCTLLADGANPVRMHLAGLVGWPVANTTAGTRGFFDLQPNPSYPLLWTSGERWISEHTNTTRLEQEMRCAADGAVARYEVYNSAGTLVRSGTFDTYSASTAIKRFVIAEGLPRATYYLHVIHNGTANAAATLPAKLYFGSRFAQDTWAASRDWITSPPDIGDAPEQGTSAAVGTRCWIGFEATNERVIGMWRASEAFNPAHDYYGGVHGAETIVGSPVYIVDGQVVDFAAGTLNQRWQGAQKIVCTYTTRLNSRTDGTPLIECAHTQTVTPAGYITEIVHTVLQDIRLWELYAPMFQVPNKSAGNTGLDGGFDRWILSGSGELSVGPIGVEQSFLDPPAAAMVANDRWAAVCKPLKYDALRAFFAGKGSDNSSGRSFFVWRRADLRDKGYWKAFNTAPVRPGAIPGEPVSVLLEAGDTFTTSAFFGVARALNAADVA